ncbi:unnamed protein product [Caenorhabditis angaria]|uniref:Uncharacterized protein n=1 Tax=Caenorhabditis angaria TaxID=860376 RepID=A0A9P1IJF1_9PELO|nr:unnamed protein product [Caenorhabditis angaria]
MTTSMLGRYQIDRNMCRSTERVEIVPQETCVQHESIITECATMTTSVCPGQITTSSTSSKNNSRRSSEVGTTPTTTPQSNKYLKV